ncbi:unnamed protein product, partial [Durusdinium trenchii]
MARPYDGNRETAKKFSRRIYRIADVLQEMGAEVDMQEVELKVLDYTPAGKGRGEGSPAGLGRGDGFRSPAIERPSAEVADLKRRVAELEGD